jgi:putative endonuclease
MSRARVVLGETGEKLACEELQRRGYAIVARNYRQRGGEIDIIAMDQQTLVFVEVKTRAGAEYGAAAEAVTWTKRRRLSATATDFMVRHGFADRACRFDVVTVSVDGGQPVCEVYRNAFDAAGGGWRR